MAVRVELLETQFGGAPVLANIEGWEANGIYRSLADGLEMDLTEPSAGARVVAFSGFEAHPPVFPLTDQGGPAWVTEESSEPKEIILAFGAHQRVHVSVVFASGSGLPGVVRIDVSDEARGTSFVPLASLAVTAGDSAARSRVDNTLWHVRFTFEGGAEQLSISKISVMEGTSDLLPLRLRGIPTVSQAMQTPEQVREGDDETQPIDRFAAAEQLGLPSILSGLVSGGDTDVFAMPQAVEVLFVLTINDSEQVLQSIGFWGGDGTPRSDVASSVGPPGSRRIAFAPFDMPRFAPLSANAGNVAVMYDTSGSLEGSELELQDALEAYVRSAPDGQRLHFVRFSDVVSALAPGQNRTGLPAALGGGIARRQHQALRWPNESS